MTAFTCLSDTGPGPCMNDQPHQEPRGCVHWASGGVHERPVRDEE